MVLNPFVVQDKKDVALWLGVGPDGICQCPNNNGSEPEYVSHVVATPTQLPRPPYSHDTHMILSPLQRFQWLQLQNIYYRDRKFSMEVYQNNKWVLIIPVVKYDVTFALSRSQAHQEGGGVWTRRGACLAWCELQGSHGDMEDGKRSTCLL